VSVEGYIGLPGQGKTYSAVARLLKEAARKGGSCEVYSNIPLIGIRYTYIESFEQLGGCVSGTVFLDELGLWMSSRDSMKLPASVRSMLAQHRKQGLDLYWTAQHENRVDAIIRELSSIYWRVSKWPWGVYNRGYDPYDAERRCGRHFVRFREEVFTAYDTSYMVGDAKTGLGGRAGALRANLPPVVLRGCDRETEGPGGEIVRYRRTEELRGILVEP
jgi:hypothetical protein